MIASMHGKGWACVVVLISISPLPGRGRGREHIGIEGRVKIMMGVLLRSLVSDAIRGSWKEERKWGGREL